MILSRFSAAFLCVSAMVSSVVAQLVIFNEPTPWITNRSDSGIVRLQLDTARIESKKITLSLSSHINDNKRTLRTKTFRIDDYAEEYNLGPIGKDLVGGHDYLKIEWKIPGSDDHGYCAPFGIVDLDAMGPPKVLEADSLQGELNEENVQGLLKDTFRTLGESGFGMLWTKRKWIIACKKTDAEEGNLTFVLDGKNGKNAFLSYPDWGIRYFPKSDSLFSFHYSRRLSVDEIRYKEAVWHNEIETIDGEELFIVMVPWHDTGVIPFDGRRMGLVAYLSRGDEIAEAIPEKAQWDLPGTWADLVLVGSE